MFFFAVGEENVRIDVRMESILEVVFKGEGGGGGLGEENRGSSSLPAGRPT